MINIFVLIPSYKSNVLPCKCLKSLVPELVSVKKIKTRVYIIDNASSDGSVAKIRKFIRDNNLEDRIELIENEENLGFAGGCNVGIRQALERGADKVLLLNQDTIVNKGFLESLIESPAEIVSPVLKFKRNGSWVYDYGGRVDLTTGRASHVEKNR